MPDSEGYVSVGEGYVGDRNKVKVTVVKMLNTEDIYGDDRKTETVKEFATRCPKFKEGQEFIVKKDLGKPEDFCSTAWCHIHEGIKLLSYGAHFPGMQKDKFICYECCTDGLRPVFFRLERVLGP